MVVAAYRRCLHGPVQLRGARASARARADGTAARVRWSSRGAGLRAARYVLSARPDARSLSLGLARQTGGFTVALRVILAGIILSVPITIYAQRAMRTAVAAMERVNAASDELMTGSRDSPISVQALTGGRVRPLARLFVVREPHAA